MTAMCCSTKKNAPATTACANVRGRYLECKGQRSNPDLSALHHHKISDDKFLDPSTHTPTSLPVCASRQHATLHIKQQQPSSQSPTAAQTLLVWNNKQEAAKVIPLNSKGNVRCRRSKKG